MMKWVWRLLDPKVRLKQSMPVEVLPEHRAAEDHWVTQRGSDHVLYDVWLRVILKPGPQVGDVVWMLRCNPRAAAGHQAVTLTWRGSVDSVYLPPVVSQELEGVSLNEIVSHISGLLHVINPEH